MKGMATPRWCPPLPVSTDSEPCYEESQGDIEHAIDYANLVGGRFWNVRAEFSKAREAIMRVGGEEDSTVYEVVVNHEEQYSIWPEYKGDPPLGWKKVGKKGLKAECLSYIKEVWTDMRPLSLRKRMEEMKARGPSEEIEKASPGDAEKEALKDPRDDLVGFLSSGHHPVEIELRQAKTVEFLKKAIDRGYVHVKFTDTRGGTELGVSLDPEECDLGPGDFTKGTGKVHLVGGLTLNYTKVRCVADIELKTLKGQGHLEVME